MVFSSNDKSNLMYAVEYKFTLKRDTLNFTVYKTNTYLYFDCKDFLKQKIPELLNTEKLKDHQEILFYSDLHLRAEVSHYYKEGPIMP